MKVCTKCKREKPISDYEGRKDRSSGLYSQCLSCRKIGLESVMKNRKVKKNALDDIKAASGCAVCGEVDPCCLDFHHLDPATKDKAVGNLYRNNKTIEALQKEIEKCITLCANCHRKYHAGKIKLSSNSPL